MLKPISKNQKRDIYRNDTPLEKKQNHPYIDIQISNQKEQTQGFQLTLYIKVRNKNLTIQAPVRKIK